MNIGYSKNYNKTSFGAYKQPPKQVMEHFADVIRELSPENRKIFVTEMGNIVKGAESCPVPISHELVSGYTQYYTPVVRGKHITTSKKHNCKANYILDVMQQASDYAKNVANADAHIEAVKKIFNLPA